jgi:Icc protein
MRFVQISDTHLGSTPDYAVRGNQSLRYLKALVHTINNLPFAPDFILHTGDVADDASEAAYKLAKPVLDTLKYPIYYLVGNHDSATAMQRVLLGKTNPAERLDYYVEIAGIGLAVYDSHGPVDPAGTLTAQQLESIRKLCTPDGPPLVIALHHQPVALDSKWLDEGWRADGRDLRMPLDCGPAFLEAIAPARNRIRGVFFGHVHWGFQIMQNGILMCSAPSALGQLTSWPNQPAPVIAPDLPGFNLVTINGNQTIVRQFTFNPETIKA